MTPAIQLEAPPAAGGGGAEVGEWTDVVFENAFQNMGFGGQDVQYRTEGDLVRLRGTAGVGAGTIFTLPPGLRPPATVTHATFNATGYAAACTVGADGAVTPVGGAGPWNLDGVCFSVTP